MADVIPGQAPAAPEATPEQLAADTAAAQAVNDDGGEIRTDQADAPIDHGSDAPAEPEQPAPPKLSTSDELREAIAARRAKAALQEAPAEAAPAAPAAPNTPAAPATPAATAPADAPADAAPGGQPPVVTAPEPLFELIVNGRKRLLTQSEMLRHAQIGMAADEKFQEAKRLREEAQRLRAAAAAPISDGTPTPRHEPGAAPGEDEGSPTAPAATPEDRKERARAMAHTLQYGEESEAAAVIEQLLEAAERARQPEPTAQDLSSAVERILTQRSLAADFQAALQKIGTEFAEELQNEDLRDLAAIKVHRERAKDLIDQGYDEGEVNELLRTDHGKRQLLQAHLYLQTQGKARGNYEVLRAAWNDVRAHLVRPAASAPATPQPAAENKARIEAKRQLPQPPAPASARIPAVAPQRPLSRSEIVAEERRARGQPV